jgi:hypothetical protein
MVSIQELIWMGLPMLPAFTDVTSVTIVAFDLNSSSKNPQYNSEIRVFEAFFLSSPLVDGLLVLGRRYSCVLTVLEKYGD